MTNCAVPYHVEAIGAAKVIAPPAKPEPVGDFVTHMLNKRSDTALCIW